MILLVFTLMAALVGGALYVLVLRETCDQLAHDLHRALAELERRDRRARAVAVRPGLPPWAEGPTAPLEQDRPTPDYMPALLGLFVPLRQNREERTVRPVHRGDLIELPSTAAHTQPQPAIRLAGDGGRPGRVEALRAHAGRVSDEMLGRLSSRAGFHVWPGLNRPSGLVSTEAVADG